MELYIKYGFANCPPNVHGYACNAGVEKNIKCNKNISKCNIKQLNIIAAK